MWDLDRAKEKTALFWIARLDRNVSTITIGPDSNPSHFRRNIHGRNF
jgi:hypothetical protein